MVDKLRGQFGLGQGFVKTSTGMCPAANQGQVATFFGQ